MNSLHLLASCSSWLNLHIHEWFAIFTAGVNTQHGWCLCLKFIVLIGHPQKNHVRGNQIMYLIEMLTVNCGAELTLTWSQQCVYLNLLSCIWLQCCWWWLMCPHPPTHTYSLQFFSASFCVSLAHGWHRWDSCVNSTRFTDDYWLISVKEQWNFWGNIICVIQ